MILRILQVAVLRIRVGGWEGDGSRCAVEADHVHNLPALLADYSAGMLRFYWQVERPSFIQRCLPADIEDFEPLWAELAALVPAGGRESPLQV